MLAEERYQKIEALIQEKGIVKASELTELFGVSLETVRRDLFFLETKGTLRRVHGGAARPQRRSEFRPFGERREEQSREKRAIAAVAVSMIREDDIIALDCDYRIELASLQNAYIKIADQSIFLADSSKFETSALIRSHPMEGGHIIITDSTLSDELYDRYTQNAIHVIRGEKDEKTVID